MEIQVAVEGKGVVTINQKVDVSAKELRRLTTHCADLLNGSRQSPRIGFGAGSELQSEVNGD